MALSAERKARMLAEFQAANQPTMSAGGSRTFDETGGQGAAPGGVGNLTAEQLKQILALQQREAIASGPGKVWYDPQLKTDDPNGWMVHEYLGQRMAENMGDSGTMVADPSLDQRFITRVRPGTGGKMADRWDLDGNYLGLHEAQDGGGRQFNTAALMFGATLGGHLAMANNGAGAAAGVSGAPSTVAPAGATGVEFGAITPEMLAGSGTAIQGGGVVGGATAGLAPSTVAVGAADLAPVAFEPITAQTLAGSGTWQAGAGAAATGAAAAGGNAAANTAGNLAKTWTVGDTLKLASGLTSAAAAADGGGGGGGGGDGEVDPAVTDAFGRAMDTQGNVIDRILSNADAILPFQQEALQFGLDSSREAYADFRADRDYAVGRRNLLTQQQDRMVADAANFNTEDRREQLAGQAVADVNRAWSGALDSARRTMTRTGRNMDSGAWKGTMRQMVADKVLAQAQGANNARAQARAEGYALTDRAAGALSYAPNAATQATAGGAGAGGAGVALTGATGQSMNNMVTPAGQLAGSWAGNATSMFNAQKNKGVGSDNTASNLALAGTLLGAGAKAWNVWGS